ncbi:MAG: DUF1664 domain-containing protein [Firmicutes bacterium]|nr:DUF1664 domain-containing protein [Bacillota bacterium]
MPDLPPTPPTTQDFPDHWGFYLLQAINRLDDKIDQVSREQQRTTDALRQELVGVREEIGRVRQELNQEIRALDTKFDHKLNALQYWYWGTLVVLILGVITLLLTHP